MAKKAKTLEVKLRSAIRLIWSRSAERRAHLTMASNPPTVVKPYKWFNCPICGTDYPIQMAEIDHEPPLGTLTSWREVVSFIDRMFYGPQRAICKICHKKKTAQQRRKG